MLEIRTDSTRREFMSRASKTVGGALVGLSLADLLAACGSSTSSTTGTNVTPLEVRFSYLVAPHHAPYFLGLERGYFTDQGLRVEFFEGQGSLSTIQLIGAGQGGDIGYADFGTMARAIGSGVPVKGFYGVVQKSPLALFFLDSSGIKTTADLKGKKFLLITGGAETVMVPAFLASQGMSMNDIKAIYVQPGTDTNAAIFSGQADVGFGFTVDAWVGNLAAKAGKNIRFFLYGDYGLHILNHGMLANLNTISSKADALRRYSAGVTKSWQATIADPNAAVQALIKRYPDRDPAIVLNELTNTIATLHTDTTKDKPLGWMSQQDWQGTIDILTKYGQMTNPRPIGDYYTNQFIA